MRILSILFVAILIQSCSKNKSTSSENLVIVQDTTNVITKVNSKKDSIKFEDLENEVMNEDALLFNGKLKRYFTLKEFENVFGKTDSTKLMSEEEPCNYIFENEDGSKDMSDKYLFKDGSRFENNKERVAVDEFRFTKNNFILFKGNKLNSSTTTNELKKLFPNAFKNTKVLNVYGEGELQVINLRLNENPDTDGHLKIFIKNGKLYFMHWWFPC